MRDIFSVLRDYRLFGNDDEGGGGGGGSDKTYNSLSEAAKDGQHGKAVNIKGKGLQKVEFADKSYNQRMATVSANAGGGGGNSMETVRLRGPPMRLTSFRTSVLQLGPLHIADAATALSIDKLAFRIRSPECSEKSFCTQ